MATKKITDIPIVGSVSLTDNFQITQGGSGKQVPVQKVSDLIAPVASTAAQTALNPSVLDGVFIMYHRKSDNYPVVSTVANWTGLQTSGEVADGVLVFQGGKHLVVAPTETSKYWSSSAVLVGAEVTDRVVALNDWNGKTLTSAIVANATLAADGDGFAPGWAHAYSRSNANGQGLTAGKWWLPSTGVLAFIMANYNRINKALAVITGANQLQGGAYWSSTEISAAYAWGLDLGNGFLNGGAKVSSLFAVRAVSAFIS